MKISGDVHTIELYKMDLKPNADRFTGHKYVQTYDKFRPAPPKDILLQSLNYLNKRKADVIVDLGCGTGISTEIWKDFADKIIGVEPSQEMIDIAIQRNKDYSIKYQLGYSNNVDLPSNSIDIVACSQSFHWMEPESTLKEINRLLKKDGVLIIYDIIWPPSVNVQYEVAYIDLFDKILDITSKLDEAIAIRWDKNEHLNNVKKSNHFIFSKETYFHKTEDLTKEKLMGIARSQGGLEALLKRGYSNEEIGITKFERKIEELVILPFDKIIYNYRVIYAIK